MHNVTSNFLSPKVKENYSDNENLKVLSYSDEIVKGSNPFAVVLVNEIIREQDLRTVNQVDLEKILKLNILNLRGKYVDSALVLRSENELNSYLARDLLRQLPNNQELPVMIPLCGLELRKDDKSNYGLAFNLTDNKKLIYNPLLNKSGNFLSEDLDGNGLPKKLGKGNRYFFGRDTGLTRVYLDDDLDLISVNEFLDDSDDEVRIVIVNI